VGLVTAVVLGAETPVNIWEDWVVLEGFYAEDAAAYDNSSLCEGERVEQEGVYTPLVHFQLKTTVIFNIIRNLYPTSEPRLKLHL
jgi:hypothetical protein